MPPGVCTIRRKLMRSAIAPRVPTSSGPPIRQRSVFRIIIAIDGRRVVARRRLRISRRRNGIVLAAVAWQPFIFAHFGCLQQGQAKFTFGGARLLGLWCRGRQPAIGRIDNPRSPQARTFLWRKYVVVCARDVSQGPALLAPFATLHVRSLPIHVIPLSLGEKLLVPKAGCALQGRVGFVGP